MARMSSLLRYRNQKKNSRTTDDLEKLSKYKSNDKVIQLISSMRTQWKLLSEVNTFICQNNMDFIKKNKPIFDNQKLMLINNDIFIKSIIEKGLKTNFDTSNKFDDHSQKLSENTFNTEWNSNSKKINAYIVDIISEYDQEKVIIDIVSIPLIKNTRLPIKTNKCKIILAILFCATVSISVYYIYNFGLLTYN
jgi:hypothetical protein